ncbi:putative F-box protein At5g55150 [Brachypodium distachyon]|uniref:putative F-box protein At5g55150 n=1 Tax=Brachypodium distachyon TaxID=15368 RepID=UPI000D0D8362|nr:putative F-box protein At5g55150 [Brachypodium distachyon]|eukprot:XP_024310326.1 putative F-box protein At5g55150 [Brachypodium distachyon]
MENCSGATTALLVNLRVSSWFCPVYSTVTDYDVYMTRFVVYTFIKTEYIVCKFCDRGARQRGVTGNFGGGVPCFWLGRRAKYPEPVSGSPLPAQSVLRQRATPIPLCQRPRSASPDWTQLPPDLLTTIFGELEILDLLHSGAVCTSWHSAYSTFRRLRLPSPKQPPCLLYASAACGPDAASLHFPSTSATFRTPEPPLRFGSLQLAGSGHGWPVAADEVSNLHLLNPITGGHVALPPITEMRGVESSLDDEGDLAYTFTDFSAPAEEDPFSLPAVEARETMYHRAVLSCSPSAGSACVVLLIHMPLAELSFARVGDERWTALAECTGLQRRNFHSNAAYNAADGLFYVLSYDGSMHTLDLNGPSPVATKIIPGSKFDQPFSSYLVQTPWGDLLQAWRFRKYLCPPTP